MSRTSGFDGPLRYRPFGDVFAGTLGPMLVDTLGTPTQPAPKDPRALIANSRAAAPRVNVAIVPGCTEAASSRSTVASHQATIKDRSKSGISVFPSASEMNGDWLLVDLGAGPWVWCLAANQDQKGVSTLRLPGVANSRKFSCELKRTHDGLWLLEDCPDESLPRRQLAALMPSFDSPKKCCCFRGSAGDDLSFVLIVPNVLRDNRCAQVRADHGDGLWEQYLRHHRENIQVYEGQVWVDNGFVTSEVFGQDGVNLLQMFQQPKLGPWKFDFNAPLSVCQAMACMLAIARALGGGWGDKPRGGIGMELAGDGDEGAIPWPSYWVRSSSRSPRLHDSPLAIDFMQRLVSATFRQKWTRDRGAHKIPSELQVVAVLRMENPDVWKRYQYRKVLVRRARKAGVATINPPLETMSMCDSAVLSSLDADVNEVYLFHGTRPEASMAIQQKGFDLSLAGCNKGKMFGGGVYFAEESAKSDEYAGLDGPLSCLLLCRVVLGEPVITYNAVTDMEHQLDRQAYDSVIGDRKAAVGTYREIIVYEEAHVYPEYVVLYHRCFAEKPCARPHLLDTTGNGVADTLLVDSAGTGIADQHVAIPEEFSEYLKHVHIGPADCPERKKKAAVQFAESPRSSQPADSGGHVTFAAPPAAGAATGPPPPQPVPVHGSHEGHRGHGGHSVHGGHSAHGGHSTPAMGAALTGGPGHSVHAGHSAHGGHSAPAMSAAPTVGHGHSVHAGHSAHGGHGAPAMGAAPTGGHAGYGGHGGHAAPHEAGSLPAGGGAHGRPTTYGSPYAQAPTQYPQAAPHSAPPQHGGYGQHAAPGAAGYGASTPGQSRQTAYQAAPPAGHGVPPSPYGQPAHAPPAHGYQAHGAQPHWHGAPPQPHGHHAAAASHGARTGSTGKKSKKKSGGASH